jgi:hypothetical protein
MGKSKRGNKVATGPYFEPKQPPIGFREEIERQRTARETKNTRLRTLRLEKEAAERTEARATLQASEPAKTRRVATSRGAPRKVVKR